MEQAVLAVLGVLYWQRQHALMLVLKAADLARKP